VRQDQARWNLVPNRAQLLSSRESVAIAVVSWAVKRIMKNAISQNELEELLGAARAAGRAEGYAQAKFEMALERAKATAETVPATESESPVRVRPGESP
jgi:hypothetical protein